VRRRTVNRMVILLAVVAVVAAVNYFSGPETAERQEAAVSPDASEARELLEGLAVSPPGSMAGYSRELFPHWNGAEEHGWDVPHPSCDVRDAALLRDGEDVVVADGCDIESGSWPDPYTGRTFSDPSDIDIDHVVPLANAWRSGASGWDEDERETYANAPEVLLSVEDDANQEKGDKGPEAWKPPNEAVWCDYAARWVGIKADYDLSVNEQEKAALQEMLETCG
jgi:hypothetical protein